MLRSRFTLLRMMIAVAVSALLLAAWRVIPAWWFLSQSIRRLTG